VLKDPTLVALSPTVPLLLASQKKQRIINKVFLGYALMEGKHIPHLLIPGTLSPPH
jgi:hypothetical protein